MALPMAPRDAPLPCALARVIVAQMTDLISLLCVQEYVAVRTERFVVYDAWA
jgi:hypothetical protein